MTSAQPRGMSDSITDSPEEQELISSGEKFTDFEFNLSKQSLRCAGYTPAEVAELLRLYREHMQILSDFAATAHRVEQEAGL